MATGFGYRMSQWINGERVEVAASSSYSNLDVCEKEARDELRGYLPGTVCEIVETTANPMVDGAVIKRIGN